MIDKKKLSGDKRTGGSNRRKEFYRKIAPWCKKNLKSGHPWDGTKVYGGSGLGERKPLTCDVCEERTLKTIGEWHTNKIVNRCEECINNGIWEILKKE